MEVVGGTQEDGREKEKRIPKPSLSSKKRFRVQEEATKKEKRIPSHHCRRKKVLSEKKIVYFFPETELLG